MSNYKIPKSRKERIAAIKMLMSGQITIADLKEPNYQFSLWRDDPTDSNFIECFAGDEYQRISKDEFKNKNEDFLTLDLS